jgi:hypothetical protein
MKKAVTGEEMSGKVSMYILATSLFLPETATLQGLKPPSSMW